MIDQAYLQKLGEIVARVDERTVNIDHKLDDVRRVHVKRLNDHAGRLDDLERTRDRQRGAAKIAAFLVAVGGAIGGFFRYGSGG